MKLKIFICLALASATFAIYWQVRDHDFINFDDELYLTANSHVVSGLKWENVRWAFRSHANDYWRPLTWLSFMLDFQLFGLNAGAHLLANATFHLVSAWLLFAAFYRMTCRDGARARRAGALWRSAWIAGLFACHPLQVQSVAWAAERGETLSACFWILTLWAYARFAQNSECRMQEPGAKSVFENSTSSASSSSSASKFPDKAEDENEDTDEPSSPGFQTGSKTWNLSRWYWLALLFFALGLMCKPTLVTLPFVLLLLDYWPLQRFPLRFTTHDSQFSQPISRLLLEKLPFLALAVISGVITFLGQQSMGNVKSLDVLPLRLRVGNALIAYVRYLGKTFWPTDLAVFYPHPGRWPLWLVLGAGLLLLILSLWSLGMTRRRPYWLVGWLWFLGMLLPVIGLIQVGAQSMADRYAYLPLIGIFIIVSWGAVDLSNSSRYLRLIVGTVGAAAMVLLIACANLQVGHWRDSASLWTHTLSCTSGNSTGHRCLGDALARMGRLNEAIGQFKKASEIAPHYTDAHNNWGLALLRQGKADEAIFHFLAALKADPTYAFAHYNLGNILLGRGELDEAARHFAAALRLMPDHAQAHNGLGIVLARQRKVAEALAHFQRALELGAEPAETHHNLGNVFNQQGQTAEAVVHYRAALKLQPDLLEVLNNLGWLLATSKEAKWRNGAEATHLATRAVALTRTNDPGALDTLAAAYAETGWFEQATNTAQQALQMAEKAGQRVLAVQIRERLRGYQNRQPWREP